MRKPHVNLQTPQFYFMKVLLGPISWQIHFPWLVQTSEQEARKKEGGVEQLVNMGVKKGVFLSGCLNRLLTDGPIRGCCVVPAAAVSSVPQCPRQIFNPHTARYGSFAKIFFFAFFAHNICTLKTIFIQHSTPNVCKICFLLWICLYVFPYMKSTWTHVCLRKFTSKVSLQMLFVRKFAHFLGRIFAQEKTYSDIFKLEANTS